MKTVQCAFVGDRRNIERVFGADPFRSVSARAEVIPEIVTPDRIDERIEGLADVEVILSTWGMPELTDAQLDRLPNLKLVLYGAGDIRGFAAPLFRYGIPVVSAWRANAVPVAQFTLAHILLAGKSYLGNVQDYRNTHRFGAGRHGPGNRGLTVALLGAGAVGRSVIRLLKPFAYRIVVFDPFLSDDDARALVVTRVSLEEAFGQGFIVSNHLVDCMATRDLIRGALLDRIPVGGTFINTGRGRTVFNDGFLEVFRRRMDLTAVLDVTHPEPLPEDSPIWDLPNVHISTHIAGTLGNEDSLMADLCLEELDRYLEGRPLLHVVPVMPEA